MRGTGEQRQYWGTGNIRKQIFNFWRTGNKPIYFKGTREQATPWEGLNCTNLASLSKCSNIRVVYRPKVVPLYLVSEQFSRKVGILLSNKTCLQNIRIKCLCDLHPLTPHFYKFFLFVCLGRGFTSQSTIFQSCQDGATASWVLPVLFGR